MRNEHKKIDDNAVQIIPEDRGEYDVVHDEATGGWYVETIVSCVAM